MEGKILVTNKEGHQSDTDRRNAKFWDDLCGSQLARSLGISDDSPESLRKFDNWYFSFYPYLSKYVPFDRLRGKKVLEVGLGYGSVTQKIAEYGADYTGLDIANGPVDMANLRLQRIGVEGRAQVGNILAAPFADESFDWVIAIGCLHHTGDLAGAIDETYRLLKPSGRATIMVYSATSYRQFQRRPFATLAHLMRKPSRAEALEAINGDEKARASYDTNPAGEGAPQTQFVSSAELKQLCHRFATCSITRENIGQDGIFRLLPREKALWFARYLGLDLYCELVK